VSAIVAIVSRRLGGRSRKSFPSSLMLQVAASNLPRPLMLAGSPGIGGSTAGFTARARPSSA
jgi:hypothetical protein